MDIGMAQFLLASCLPAHQDIEFSNPPNDPPCMCETLMSLVLVYARTPTIFANFRTFIRFYLIIFHHYITLYVATLHHTSTLHYSYVTTLCHTPTSQPYVATLRRTSMSHLRCIATTSLHHIATTSCCST
jgi:hypothetical protein